MANPYPILDESTRDGNTGYWTHDRCGTHLVVKAVYHPIYDTTWDGTAGYGDVAIENVPYCQVCGRVPSNDGIPVYR